jgi:hypothetical protein
MKRPKKDTSHMLKEVSGYTVNEWLEVLLRIRDEQPQRYEREVSEGLKVTVENYAALKLAQGRRRAA